jgi:hypothetical protein
MLRWTTLFLVLATASGHARWKCPLARDKDDASGAHIVFDNTGNKNVGWQRAAPHV